MFIKFYVGALVAAIMIGFVLPTLFSAKDDIYVFLGMLIVFITLGAVGNGIYNKLCKESKGRLK